jgi:hypothetical protein
MSAFEQFREQFERYSPSAWALVLANVAPLLGVLFLGWDAFDLVALYWAENVVIGAINVLKILACSPNADWLVLGNVDPGDKLNRERMERSRGNSVTTLRWAHQASKLFFVPFFVCHYGLFCFVHGAFIFTTFNREAGGFGPFGGFHNLLQVFSEQHLWWCIGLLAASHLWSFAVNYIGRGEYRRSAVPILMFQPYGRIVVLHVAILIGGFIAFMLGSNVLVMLTLIIGKTFLDLGLHLAQRISGNVIPPKDQPEVLPEIIP